MHQGAWPTLEIQNLEKSLTGLHDLVNAQARSAEDEVLRALSRFLIIRSCGFLEQVSEECCRAYLASKADPRSSGFGGSWLGRGRNPSPGNLVELVRRFDAAWADELEDRFNQDDERLRREVSFLVDRRNKIAHGLSEGVGVRKAMDLVLVAIEVTEWFILRLDPR